MFLKFRVIDDEYIVKISRGVVKHVYKVHKFALKKKLWKRSMSGLRPLTSKLLRKRYIPFYRARPI